MGWRLAPPTHTCTNGPPPSSTITRPLTHFQIPDSKHQILNTKIQNPSPKPQAPKPKPQNPSPKTQAPLPLNLAPHLVLRMQQVMRPFPERFTEELAIQVGNGRVLV